MVVEEKRCFQSSIFAIVLSEVLCKQNILLPVAAERFNTITNSSRVGVGLSPAGRRARRCKLYASELHVINPAKR
jgi:hypothetical protein